MSLKVILQLEEHQNNTKRVHNFLFDEFKYHITIKRILNQQ